MKKIMAIITLLILLISNTYAETKPNLLFYCGITMVKPMKEIAKIIEQKHNCKITISQGGSKDLYDSLKFSKIGDLYLPGSDSYRKKYLKDGYLLDSEYIGFNQAAIFVQKGNPKNIKSLDRLLDENIATILCNPKSGSIGKMTQKLLTSYKGEDFYYDAFDYAAQIGTDSRNLNKAISDKSADMTINWRATGYFTENKKYIDIVEIDEKYAPKKKLVLNLLSFSKNKEIAKAFMKFAASKKGQEIMKKHGFR
ncbi:MAG: substrate-binding domain-containing protein [Campylobacterota bacterium]|nr:substrate-binding domain-containing protein [Campylobacterota bacterium]